MTVITVGNMPVVCGIFRAGLRGDVRFRVSADLAKWNKIGCGMNKIGWFIKSKHRAGYTRCVPEQNRVVRGEHFLGAVIGAVLGRTPKKRFGVLHAHKA